MKQYVPVRLAYFPQSDQHRKISRVVVVPLESTDSSCSSYVVVESKNKKKSSDSLMKTSQQQTALNNSTTFPTSSMNKPSGNRRVLNLKLQKMCAIILAILALLYVIGIIIAIVVILLQPKTNTTTSIGSTTTTTAISLVWNTSGITIAGVTGTAGNTPTTLNQPSGIAFDSLDAIYVADENNHRIQKFVNGITTGVTVSNQTSAAGCSGVGYMYAPLDVFVNANQTVLVTDSGCNNIRIWPRGVTIGILFAGTVNPPGSGSHQFYTPSGITVDSRTGTIYVSDSGNNRVMAYPVGATNGTRVAGGNATGTTISQLNQPTGLFFDASSNSLIIANTNGHNIVRWTLGASIWTLVAGDINGNAGSSSTALNSPRDVIKDSMGNLYVADSGNHRIQFFPIGQTNSTTIAGTGSAGSSSNSLNGPYSVALDSQLNLYVADRLNHRIQKFVRS